MRPAVWIPFIIFVLLGLGLAVGLTLKPREIPSALIDEPVPTFDLAGLTEADPGLASGDLGKGDVVLLNVFASWCAPCRIEHPFLADLADKGYIIHGLNYKDRPEDARAFLDELGNPYASIGADRDGRVGIELGVYGVPETYVISGGGRILYKHVGPILPQNRGDLIKALEAARHKGAS